MKLEEYQSTIIAAAAKTIMDQISPVRLQECAEEIVSQALKNMMGSYGALTRAVETVACETMSRVMQEPKMKESVERAVRLGITEATQQLSEQVKGRITDLAFKAIESAVAQAKSSRY